MDLTEGGIRVPWIAHWPARIAPGGVSDAALHDDGLVGDDARCRLRRADPAFPLDGVSLLPVLDDAARTVRAAALLADESSRPARPARGRWKYLRVDGHDYLFDLAADERERANRGPREPARLEAMRADWEAWNATMPPIPADATVSLGYGAKDMPQR